MPTELDVNDFARHQEHERHRSPATVRGYRDELLRLVRREVPLERTALAAWIATGDDGGPLAPNTRNRRLVILRTFFGYLRAEGKLAEDPTVGIARARVPRPVRSALTARELRRLIAELRREAASWRRIRDEAILLLLFHTGLRVSELRSLELRQVDFAARTLREIRRKGGDLVDIPLNDEAKRALSAWLHERPATHDQAVFVGGPTACRLTVRAIQKRLSELGDAAGLRVAVHPHALRHAHATALMRRGTSTEIIRQSLHHASLGTTQRYLHGEDSDLRAALNRLPTLASTPKSGQTEN